jgi:hypothetical protein
MEDGRGEKHRPFAIYHLPSAIQDARFGILLGRSGSNSMPLSHGPSIAARHQPAADPCPCRR